MVLQSLETLFRSSKDVHILKIGCLEKNTTTTKTDKLGSYEGKNEIGEEQF